MDQFSFVDLSLTFSMILKFHLSHPRACQENFYCLNDKDCIGMGNSSIVTTTGDHILYSRLLSNHAQVTLKLEKIEGSVEIGLQSLSLFRYSTSLYRCNCTTRGVWYNCQRVATLDSHFLSLTFDPEQKHVWFNEQLMID
jgi:hypothetical protein